MKIGKVVLHQLASKSKFAEPKPVELKYSNPRLFLDASFIAELSKTENFQEVFSKVIKAEEPALIEVIAANFPSERWLPSLLVHLNSLKQSRQGVKVSSRLLSSILCEDVFSLSQRQEVFELLLSDAWTANHAFEDDFCADRIACFLDRMHSFSARQRALNIAKLLKTGEFEPASFSGLVQALDPHLLLTDRSEISMNCLLSDYEDEPDSLLVDRAGGQKLLSAIELLRSLRLNKALEERSSRLARLAGSTGLRLLTQDSLPTSQWRVELSLDLLCSAAALNKDVERRAKELSHKIEHACEVVCCPIVRAKVVALLGTSLPPVSLKLGRPIESMREFLEVARFLDLTALVDHRVSILEVLTPGLRGVYQAALLPFLSPQFAENSTELRESLALLLKSMVPAASQLKHGVQSSMLRQTLLSLSSSLMDSSFKPRRSERLPSERFGRPSSAISTLCSLINL